MGNTFHNYRIYRHTLPDGRYYIGKTSNTEARWSYHGIFYKKSRLFYEAIQEYGWDNIKHEVLESNLCEEDAAELEKKYIKEAKTLGLSLNIKVSSTGCLYGSKLGKHHTKKHILQESAKWRNVPIKVYKQDALVGEFESLHHAARELGLARKNLQRWLKHDGDSRNGYSVIKINEV